MNWVLPSLLLAGVAWAEPSAEWVDLALTNNPALRAAHAKWQAARERVPQADALEDPMVGVDVMRDSTRLNSAMANEYMVSQKLPWFGKRAAKATVARLEAEVIGFQYLDQARALRGQVLAAQWDLWLAQQMAAVGAENQRLLEQLAKVAQARYAAGQASQADVLRAKMELSRTTGEAVTLEREVEVAQAAVNRLLGTDPQTPRRLASPPPLPVLADSLEELQLQARQYCCILMSFLRAVAAREAGVRVAKLENAPDIEVRVAARQFNGRSGIQEYDTGIALNFPWLWRDKYRAVRQQAAAELAMAQADFDAEVNMTLLEIKQLYTQAEVAGRRARIVAEEILPATEKLVATTRAGYEAGNATFLELIEAQKLWRDAQLDHERARAAAGRARAKLDAVAAPWGEFEFQTGLVTRGMQ